VNADQTEIATRDTFFDQSTLLNAPRGLTNGEEYEHSRLSEKFGGRITRSNHLAILKPAEEAYFFERSSGGT
jgi:hypothetical protein